MFRYFTIRNFEISKYWPFQIFTPTPIIQIRGHSTTIDCNWQRFDEIN